MKITILALVFCCFVSVTAQAQNNYSIKGSVADTASGARLTNTTIAVLNAKDSILQKFTRVSADGTFAIDGLKKGDFLMLATYPGYADYVEKFTLDSVKRQHDFGRISMILKSQLLAEVIVKGQAAAIKIKGDTTEFNAAAFQIQPNAKVEDLLKQLPGIQVDKDGKITAQGQTVKKVLVDGEEFFGDDPTLVTKNLRADMVDKVQLYDKKSDQAAFTGIDDGVKDKTINIKLKEDKKNGYFGKVDAGVGTDGYYSGQVLFNRFKAKQKFSAYTTLGNNGKTGLGWEDNSKYGGGGGLEFGDGGEMYLNDDSNDELDSFSGRYDGEGKPLARTGGLHYDTKWNDDKQSINTNYKIGTINVDGTKNTLTQNNLPGNYINTNTDQDFHNYMFRQKLDATYQVKLDSTSNLKIKVDGTDKHSTVKNTYATSSTRGNGVLLNNNDRDVTNNIDSKIFNASAFYTKKFKKPGRTFSLNVSEALNQSKSKGYLKSEIDYYNDQAALDSSATIDQYKTTSTKSAVLNTSLTYTEPLTKALSLVFNYGIGIDNATSDRRSYNKAPDGSYTIFDDTLSNKFKLNQLSNLVGAVFNYKKNKTTINFGTKVANVNFKQTNEYTGDILTRNFVNWSPQANFLYRFSQQEAIRITYDGNTTQPTIDQIQPVKVNTDPLNITLGNPTLKPSFTNRFGLNYNSYKIVSGQYIWLGGSYSLASNPIVSNIVTDSAGVSTYRSSNLHNHQTANMYFYGSFDRKIDFLNMTAGFGTDINGNTYYNMANGQLNKTTSYTYSGSVRLMKNKEKKYDIYLSAGPTYTVNSSSLQQQINNNGRGFQANGQFNIYLPAGFQVGSDGNYQYNAPTQSFNEDFRRFILNANLAKTFLKSQALKISLQGNDLLNQNKGYNRTGSTNILTQERYTTIKRYFMLSVTWDFNKVGGGATK